ncbi:MAG: Rpn family recombination-promoting nuclease/putative transposase [Thermodesulfobacteriaceae bacterium]|nr:Rpn family recombination-promoting nuclease/putative transposase [Thermodesulfobacteriaceae bacterium]
MSEPKPYDLYAKAILKDPENLKVFLKEFLPKEILSHLDLSQLVFVPEEQISLSKEKRLLPDIIVQVPLLGKPLHLYILLEHKSYQDVSVYAQILNYISSLFEKALKEGSKPIPVLPFIFYHGEKPWLYPIEFVELFEIPPEIKSYFLNYRVLLLDLVRLNREELLKRIELYSVVYAYLYLLRSLDRPLEELLRGVVRFVEVVGKLSERERWYVELFLLIVSKEKGLDEEEVWIKLREVGGERMEFELKTYSERKYEQGLQEGLQKGLQQGIQEGLLREAQEMVLEVVEVKLGRVPEVLKREIEAEQDREKLRRLLRELVISLDPEKTLLNFGYSLD